MFRPVRKKQAVRRAVLAGVLEEEEVEGKNQSQYLLKLNLLL